MKQNISFFLAFQVPEPLQVIIPVRPPLWRVKKVTSSSNENKVSKNIFFKTFSFFDDFLSYLKQKQEEGSKTLEIYTTKNSL